MTAQPPLAERALPPETADRIRSAIRAEIEVTQPARVRWRTALVAAAVALLVIGLTYAVWLRPETRLVAGPPPSPGERVVLTDVGPLGTPLTETELKTCRQPEDPAVREVLYARLVSSGPSPSSAIVYRKRRPADHAVRGGFHGPTRGDERGYQPSTRYPVVPLAGIVSAGWMPGATTGEATDYTTFQAFAAAPEVETVQLRAVVAGRPGPWFVGTVHNGFVVVPLVEPGPVPLSINEEPQISFERRAVDRDGRLVAVK